MTDTTDTDTTDTEKTPYEPPAASWRPQEFIKASLEEAQAKCVDCPTCPVSMLCEAGEGGTGWVCPICNATGVYVDHSNDAGVPDDVLAIDCGKHKFWRRDQSSQITKCPLCSGGLMQLEVLCRGTKNHLIFTTHAKVSLAERHQTLRDAFDRWTKHYAKRDKAEAAEKAKADKEE